MGSSEHTSPQRSHRRSRPDRPRFGLRPAQPGRRRNHRRQGVRPRDNVTRVRRTAAWDGDSWAAGCAWRLAAEGGERGGGQFACRPAAVVPRPGPAVWRITAEWPAGIDGGSDHAGGSISDAAAIDLLHALLKERVGDGAPRVTDPSWVSVFRFHRRLASTYRRGRILLAGDAA